MRLSEIATFDKDLQRLLEYGTGGGTSSGAISSIANPIGGVISRTPNLFGYIPASKPSKKRKSKRSAAKPR